MSTKAATSAEYRSKLTTKTTFVGPPTFVAVSRPVVVSVNSSAHTKKCLEVSLSKVRVFSTLALFARRVVQLSVTDVYSEQSGYPRMPHLASTHSRTHFSQLLSITGTPISLPHHSLTRTKNNIPQPQHKYPHFIPGQHFLTSNHDSHITPCTRAETNPDFIESES